LGVDGAQLGEDADACGCDGGRMAYCTPATIASP
jgi:hypothetical protein